MFPHSAQPIGPSINKRSWLLGFLLAAAVQSSSVAAENRFALVIGNSDYPSQRLRNPGNDADAIESALAPLGFTVLKYKDVDRREMGQALRTFRSELKRQSVAFVFFAGHGIQVKGENYLVPTKAKPREEYEVQFSCFPVRQILAALEESESNLKVVVLDCCRDNPFERSWSRTSSATGLATIGEVPEGTLIAYATGPGQTAADGRRENSPYSRHLCKVLKSRPASGLELVDVFREASRGVKAEMGQRPWVNMEASLPRFYLWLPAISSRPEPRPSPNTVPSESAELLAHGGKLPKRIAMLVTGTWVASTTKEIHVFREDGTLTRTSRAGTKHRRWITLAPDGSVVRIAHPTGWIDTLTYVSNSEWSVVGERVDGRRITWRLLRSP